MVFDFDIAIVGGGPAGSSTALHLARAEGIDPARVLILDKARHPREKPCAGAVSAWGVAALGAINVPVVVPQVAMAGLRVLAGEASDDEGGGGSAPRPRVSGESARPGLGIVVRRNEFDDALLRRAAGDGTRLRDGEGVRAIEAIAGGFRLATVGPSAGFRDAPGPRGATVTARFVAACDGAGSTVRKLLELKEPARKGHLYVLETDATPADSGVARGFCDFDLAVSDEGLEGYYWDFPTQIDGKRAVSRGIYHANFTPRRDVKAALGRHLAKRGVAIANVTLKPFSTRPFVRNTLLCAPAAPGIVFVGEAAGIDATTGEGIAQAILMGKVAAFHLARALRARLGDVSAYAWHLPRTRVGRHLLQSAGLARRVYGPRGAAYRRFLIASDAAREAGAAWYGGVHLGVGMKARLAAGLGVELGRQVLAAGVQRA